MPGEDLDIRITDETDVPRGWSFTATIAGPGHRSTHDVRLSWVDYDHWSRGSAPPVRVVELCLRFLVERIAEGTLPPRFDVATMVRRHPELDEHLRTAL